MSSSPFADDMFDRMRRVKAAVDRDDARQERFECTVVRRMARLAKPPVSDKQLAAECRDLTGDSSPSLEWFYQRFPLFPVRLLPYKMQYIHEITLADLFQRFTKLPFYTAYWDQAAADGVDTTHDYAALVFTWPQIAGLMTMHNYPRACETAADDPEDKRGGARVVRPIGGVAYVLEPLSSLVTGLHEVWCDS